MPSKPVTSQTVHRWLETLEADFDPSESHAPTRRRATRPTFQPGESGVRLEEAIGKGGMAIVHRGRQLSLDRDVAIKIKRSDLDGDTVDIWHEAWLTSALEHPNIVPIYDLTLDDAGDPMVVMRRIEGTEWGKLFGEPATVFRDFGASDAMGWHLRVFLQVCNAVHYAHSMGVIHRDIKPANIMVGTHGQVYLLDWGIAIGRTGPLAKKLNDLRGGTEPAGTPCYLAPEMLSGTLDCIDGRTDVYLLGATLFQLVTGRPPHPGTNLEQVLQAVATEPVAIPDDLPAELQVILGRALAQDPDQRFADVAELRAAVESYLGHRSSYQLEEHAREHLTALLLALETRHLDNPQDRAELYKLYTACRAAYRAALQLWEGNPKAKAGLYEATASMIDSEIEHGTPRAATALLAEIHDPPDELVLRVSDAQHSEGLAHDDMRQMASIARRWSSQGGARLRVVMVVMLGLFYGIFSAFVPAYHYLTLVVLDGVGLVAIGIFSLLMRRLDRLSAFNARSVIVLSLLLAVQIGRRTLAMATDTPHDVVLAHDGLVFLSILSVAAISFEWRLWPSCFVYAAGYVLAAIDVSSAGAAYGVGHLFTTANVAWIWWPRNRTAPSIPRRRKIAGEDPSRPASELPSR